MSGRTVRHGRRGITLIEVLVAIAVLLVMSTMSWEAVSASMQVNELLALGDQTQRTARSALAKLRRELQLAYLTPNREAVNTYQTTFVGLDDNPDQLFFATLAHQRLYRNSRESDQAEISVWTEPSPREQGDGHILYHRESPRIDEVPDEQGTILPLAYNVRTFNVRYLDNTLNEWVDEWDVRNAETPYRLPRAVQIGLVLLSPDPDDPKRTVENPFLTTVVVERGPRLVQSASGIEE